MVGGNDGLWSLLFGSLIEAQVEKGVEKRAVMMSVACLWVFLRISWERQTLQDKVVLSGVVPT